MLRLRAGRQFLRALGERAGDLMLTPLLAEGKLKSFNLPAALTHRAVTDLFTSERRARSLFFKLLGLKMCIYLKSCF